MVEWERERIIENFSGAELERWEDLGFEMTPKMVARLKHWRDTSGTRALAQAAERKARERVAMQEAEADHRRFLQTLEGKRKRGRGRMAAA